MYIRSAGARLSKISASPKHQNGLSDHRDFAAMYCQLIGSCQKAGTMSPARTGHESISASLLENPAADGHATSDLPRSQQPIADSTSLQKVTRELVTRRWQATCFQT